VLHGVRPVKYSFFHSFRPAGKHGFFNILPMDAVEFNVGETRYSVPVLPSQFDNFRKINPQFQENHVFRKGDTILDCVVQTGDQLFVDRFTYNFCTPKRGDVFVFETDDLLVQNPGDFYIKRIGGIPGDKLQIKDPDLYVNDRKVTEPIGFVRVMSGQDGYRGYTSNLPQSERGYLMGPEDSYTLKKREYFALGDNSYSSSDSRFWGPVPYKNIVGRGFFVYWPFTRHFGRVE
jgi:signal peptidase I